MTKGVSSMKNKKTTLAFILLSVLVVTANAQQYDPENDFSITKQADGKSVAITKYVGSKQTVRIPPTIQGLPVTSIGDRAFFFYNRLTSVTIPTSVTSIGESAFRGNQLTSVIIGNSVISIKNFAFQNNQLTSVIIPNSVISIGEGVFRDNKLTSVTIGNSVTSIGDIAFLNNQLTSVIIPSSLTSIGYSIFSLNQSLTAINVDSDNPKYSSADGILYNKNRTALLEWPAGKIDVTIPDSVTSIWNGAFMNNQQLTSIIIPDSVISIGNAAFSGCSSLTSVTIGNNITNIGNAAFSGCSSLTSVTIPDSVTSIGEWAFFRCSSLTSVTISNSVTSIGKLAFNECNNLINVLFKRANIAINNDTFPSGNSLRTAYNEEGIGIYTRVNTTWTKTLAFAQPPTVTVQPAIIEMVRIEGGTFIMGSPSNEPERNDVEIQHQVRVSSFYMGKYEVTQKEYQEIMETNHSFFKGDNLPVEQVLWYEAIEYCNRLSQKEGLTPAYTIDKNQSDPNNTNPLDNLKWTVTWNRNTNGYRLPTEAEWEYACRAGTTTPFNTGNNITTSQANYNGNYPYNNNAKGEYQKKTMPVGTFAPNAWGLYDMHGNVYEWCWDWYGNYTSGSQTNPEGTAAGNRRVIRGGSWSRSAGNTRSAFRNGFIGRDPDVGLRLVRSLVGNEQ